MIRRPPRPARLLRTRLGLLLVAALVLALAAFAGLADVLFVRLQLREMRGLLERELARVARLVQQEAVGQRFLDTGGGGLVLQFVTSAGAVVIPAEGGEPLPLPPGVRPALVEREGRRLMVASAPWRLPSGVVVGTVRLGLDASDLLLARRTLRLSMALAGAVIAAAVTALALVLLRRALGPLGRLADEASRLDPADPKLADIPSRDDEVGRVADALRRAIGAIRDHRRAERDALAEVAHELAAPLSVVAGQLEALAARDADPSVRAARDAAHELLYTSQDLLTLARGELEVPLRLEAVALAEVARRVAAEYAGTCVAARGDTRVLGSPERLAQVVRNLVRNGVQAAGDAKRVRVRVEPEGDEVVLLVSDDGPGMDEEARARAFERHFTRRRGGDGSGLGLSVVRAIVEAHGGSASVVAGGPGATLRVALPSLRAQLGAES